MSDGPILHLGEGRLYVAPANTPAPPVEGEWWEQRPVTPPPAVEWTDIGEAVQGTAMFGAELAGENPADLCPMAPYQAGASLTGRTLTVDLTWPTDPAAAKLLAKLTGLDVLQRERARARRRKARTVTRAARRHRGF